MQTAGKEFQSELISIKNQGIELSAGQTKTPPQNYSPSQTQISNYSPYSQRAILSTREAEPQYPPFSIGGGNYFHSNYQINENSRIIDKSGRGSQSFISIPQTVNIANSPSKIVVTTTSYKQILQDSHSPYRDAPLPQMRSLTPSIVMAQPIVNYSDHIVRSGSDLPLMNRMRQLELQLLNEKQSAFNLQVKNDALEKKLKEIESKKNFVINRDEIVRLSNLVKEKDQIIFQLGEERAQYTKRTTNLQNQWIDSQSEKLHYQRSYNTLLNTISDIQNKMVMVMTENERLQFVLGEKEKLIMLLQSQTSHRSQQLELQSNILQLEAKLDQMVKENEQIVIINITFQKQNQQYLDTINQLERKLADQRQSLEKQLKLLFEREQISLMNTREIERTQIESKINHFKQINQEQHIQLISYQKEMESLRKEKILIETTLTEEQTQLLLFRERSQQFEFQERQLNFDAQSRIQDLQLKLTNIISENERLVDVLQLKEQEIEKIAMDLSTRHREVQVKNYEVDAQNRELESQIREIQLRIQQNDRLNRDLQSKSKECDLKELQILELQQKIEHDSVRHCQKLEQLRSQYDGAYQNIWDTQRHNIQKKLDSSQKENVILSEKLKQISHEFENLKKQNQEIIIAHDEMKSKIHDISRELQDQLALSKFDMETLQEDNNQLRDQQSEQQRKYEKLSRQYNVLNESFKKREYEVQMNSERVLHADLKMEVTINELKSEHQAQLRSEIHRFMSEMSNLKQYHEEESSLLKLKILQKEQTFDLHFKEKQNLSNQIQRQKMEIEEYRLRLQQSEHEIQLSQMNARALEQDFENVRSDLKNSQRAFIEVKSKNYEQDLEIEKLKKEIDKIKNELENLAGGTRNYEQEIQRKQNQIQTLNEKLLVAQQQLEENFQQLNDCENARILHNFELDKAQKEIENTKRMLSMEKNHFQKELREYKSSTEQQIEAATQRQKRQLSSEISRITQQHNLSMSAQEEQITYYEIEIQTLRMELQKQNQCFKREISEIEGKYQVSVNDLTNQMQKQAQFFQREKIDMESRQQQQVSELANNCEKQQNRELNALQSQLREEMRSLQSQQLREIEIIESQHQNQQQQLEHAWQTKLQVSINRVEQIRNRDINDLNENWQIRFQNEVEKTNKHYGMILEQQTIEFQHVRNNGDQVYEDNSRLQNMVSTLQIEIESLSIQIFEYEETLQLKRQLENALQEDLEIRQRSYELLMKDFSQIKELNTLLTRENEQCQRKAMDIDQSHPLILSLKSELEKLRGQNYRMKVAEYSHIPPNIQTPPSLVPGTPSYSLQQQQHNQQHQIEKSTRVHRVSSIDTLRNNYNVPNYQSQYSIQNNQNQNILNSNNNALNSNANHYSRYNSGIPKPNSSNINQNTDISNKINQNDAINKMILERCQSIANSKFF